MEKAPGLTIPSRNNIDEAFIQTSYTIATDYLRECYSYIFAAGDAVVCDFTVGTWSFKTKRSEVLKKTDEFEDTFRRASVGGDGVTG